MAEPPLKRARRPDSSEMRDRPPEARGHDRSQRDDGRRPHDRERRYRSRSRERYERPRQRSSSRGKERAHYRERERERDREREREKEKEGHRRDGRDARDARDGNGDDKTNSKRGAAAKGGYRPPRERSVSRERNHARRGDHYPSLSLRRCAALVHTVQTMLMMRTTRGKKDDRRRSPRRKGRTRTRSRSPRRRSRTRSPPAAAAAAAPRADRKDIPIRSIEPASSSANGGRAKTDDAVDVVAVETADEPLAADDVEAQMQALMGFGGFETTKQKKVAGNNLYAVRKEKKTEYRQYMPNLYFGVRPRIPKSLLFGLLWAKVDEVQAVQNNFRYTCEQHEGMAGYGWDEYDVRTGGRQMIHDAGNHLDLLTEFTKIPGGSHGGSWGVRIKGIPRDDAPPQLRTTVVFNAAVEGLGALEVANEQDGLGFEGTVTLDGTSSELGDFHVDVTRGPESNAYPVHTHPSHARKPLDRTFVHSTQLPEEALWQTKNIMFTHMKDTIDGYLKQFSPETVPPPWQLFTIPHAPGQGNFHLIQKTFEGPFEFDVLFSSASAPERVTSEILSKAIQAATASFSQRAAEQLVTNPPFDSPKYEAFSRSMFSNLVGGIGYFYGDSIVDRSYAPEYEEQNEGFWQEAAEARARNLQRSEGPSELFTSIPSRPFFPRGFLWDEGFHLLPVIDWDLDLTLEIVKSWFNLVDDDGWIAREQILGPEARSKVPQEFTIQYPHYANPPTLFFILQAFLDKLQRTNGTDRGGRSRSSGAALGGRPLYTAHLDEPGAGRAYLRALYPLLKRHYFWFRKTQRGDVASYDRPAFSTKEAYRWRGRTPRHILTSGLDDYPRAQPPHPGELHVDLLSWIGMMSGSMKRIAAAIDETDDAHDFAGHEAAIVRNLDDLHWDPAAHIYCDASIDDYEESVHVCRKGYISLFPFMLGLVPPTSARLGPLLHLIANPDELWSAHGIRSLSKQDPAYATDENYWRSPVWINMNYLIILRLLELGRAPGPHQAQAARMYGSLRRNVVDTVYAQWRATGFAWEQYNPETGAGQRTQHFTGWTALVVTLMKMPAHAVPDQAAVEMVEVQSEDGRADAGAGSGSGHDEL
ncbi:MAG: Processing alpha glucosidase I [Phylliscum demangeonii]|nr:MAG: Processing alpha glucosidase I [Phylliscum demangeonii]